MANFLLIGDPNSERRRRLSRAAVDRIAFLEGLVVTSAELPPFAAVWARGPSAPVSVTRWEKERLAIAWGEPRLSDGTLLRAEEVGDRWTRAREAPPPEAFDGFFAAALLESDGRLQVAADIVGTFPVYHAERGEAILVGSSPELFRLHPLSPPRLDREGLVGLLLTHAPHAGRTLLQGVRRLPPGHLLRWTAAEGGREIRQYRIPEPRKSAGGDFRDDVERLHLAWSGAVRRHAPPDQEVGLLLSGGRDSRLLAGYLSDQGTPFRALTFGRPGDHDVRCARAVARELEVPHEVFCARPEDFPGGAALTARWEHVIGGFSNVHTWAAIAALRLLPSRTITGHLREIREIDPLPRSFDDVLSRANRHGVSPETLKRLLVFPGAEDLVEVVKRSIRQDFEARSHEAGSRGWRFFLGHEWRAHAGGIPWRFSFGSWPVVPAIDREVLETIAGLPDESIGSRRGQDRIFRDRFPALARLPLDRNSNHTLPLLPTVWDRARSRMRRHFGRFRARRSGARRERRYYYRMYDLDEEGWRRVRRLAEPHRERLADVFDMDELACLVPPPDEDIRLPHKILDGYGPKLLLGLMLWAEDHLP